MGPLERFPTEIPPKCIGEETWNLITMFKDLLYFSQSDFLLDYCSVQVLSPLPKSILVRVCEARILLDFLRGAFQLHISDPDVWSEVGTTDLGATISYSAAREEGLATDVVL